MPKTQRVLRDSIMPEASGKPRPGHIRPYQNNHVDSANYTSITTAIWMQRRSFTGIYAYKHLLRNRDGASRAILQKCE